MKDSSVGNNEIEQKKFSFDMRPTEHRTTTEVETVPEVAHTPSGDESVEPTSVIDSVDDVSDEVMITTGGQNADRGSLPGDVLSAERKRRGFSVADIASQLFLTEAQINALEADDYDKFPAAIFVTGYIRNYARLLDLPADPLVELFNAQNRPSAPNLDRISRSASTVSKSNLQSLDPRIIGGVVVAIALILLLWWGMSADEEGTVVVDDTPMVDSRSSIEPSLPAIDTVVTPIESSDPEVKAPASNAITPTEVAKEPPSVVETEKTAETQSGIETETESEAGTEFIADSAVTESLPDTIELTFSAESWVEITDANGRRVMFDLGKPGQTRVLSGTAPFKILFGNSPAVTMIYNGEPFDQSSLARGKVARFVFGKRSN